MQKIKLTTQYETLEADYSDITSVNYYYPLSKY